MTSTDAESTISLGRPRSRELDERIISVTLDLLTRMTYERMTIAEIAKLSGCPKSSIYRRYADLRAIVVAAIEHDIGEDIFPIPDHGSLCQDIAGFIETVAQAMNDRRARILASLLFTMRDDPTLAAPLMRLLADLHTKGWRPIVERAVKRGELVEAALSADILADVASAVLFQRVMVQRLPITRDFLQNLKDLVILPSLETFRVK